jgi:hypothetical protein
MAFRENWNPPPAPDEDVLVYDLDVPAAAEGAVVAICDGYENQLQLRSKRGDRSGSFAAWVAPAYRAEVEAVLAELARRYGVKVSAPRPFEANDLAAGMHLVRRRGATPP